MEIPLPVLTALLGAGAGLLIGCVGIGGVIVVPALVYAFDVPVHTAIAAAMFAFLMSGAVGTGVYAQRRSIRWDMAGWMWAGAMPAAFAGALLANATAPQWIEAAIGVLAAVTGLHAWRSSGAAKRRGREPVQRVEPESRQALPKPTLAVVGAFTGVTSALTGTGGPLVLMPILVSLEVPLLAALGLAQAIQLPIAVLATAGNVAVGALDVATGALLGAGIVLGTWAGARLAHGLRGETLRRAVAGMLVVVGTAILLKVAL